MTCAFHMAPQMWCVHCCALSVVGNPLLRETVVGPMPLDVNGTSRNDASAARIAGLERSVNEKRSELAVAQRLITDITDALRITGPHQGIDDDEILPAVREHMAEHDAMKQALRDALALVDALGFMSAERQIELRRLRGIAK